MDKRAFLKTAIEVLKYDDKFKKIEKREILIKLLSRSSVNFLPQWGFVGAGVPDQRWEIVEVRCPVPLLNEAHELESDIDKIVSYVYEESEEHALQKVNIRPLVIDTPPEIVEHEVVFDELQDTVIQGIRDAKYMIWVAVAWFTDPILYEELKKKKLLNDKVYEQSIGFMRVIDGDNPLDKTNIHTESYDKTLKLLNHLGLTTNDLGTEKLIKKLDKLNVTDTSKLLDIDIYTLNDIIESLKQPNRDFRDDYDMPLLKSDILTIDNLKPGMKLEGTVRNVVDFGAFIDIGLHNDGLVHISKITNKFIKHPSEVLSVGDIVTCYVIDINKDKEKVSLSLIDPNN